MNTPDGIDLQWLAFEYIAGEMSADEAKSFERRLEVDQAAREALAGTVQLSQAIASLPPRTVDGGGHSARNGRFWLVPIIAAASMAFAVGLGIAQRGTDIAPLAGGTGDSNAEFSEFAQNSERWTALWLQSERAAAMLHDVLELETADADDAESPSLAVGLDSDSDVAVPGWMIAAAAVIDPAGATDSLELENSTPREN